MERTRDSFQSNGPLPLSWPLGDGAPEGAESKLLECVQVPPVWREGVQNALASGWTAEAVRALKVLQGKDGADQGKAMTERERCSAVWIALVDHARKEGQEEREFLLLVALWGALPAERFVRRPWNRYRARLLTLVAVRLGHGREARSNEEYDALGQLFAALLEGLFRKFYRRFGMIGDLRVPWEDFRQTLLTAALRQTQRFDPDRGTVFSTLAVPHLVMAARRTARAQVLGVKPGQVDSALRKAAKTAGRSAFAVRVLTPAVSLDAPIYTNDGEAAPLGEAIADSRAGDGVQETWLALVQAADRMGLEAPSGFMDRLREVYEGSRRTLPAADRAVAAELARAVGLMPSAG